MQHYLLIYDVVDDYLVRRAPLRAEHLRLIREAHERGDVVMAGALANPADGAVIIFRGESPEVAEAFAKADPYVVNGLITRWQVRDWVVVAGG
jgi:uncharacterized protein YciI